MIGWEGIATLLAGAGCLTGLLIALAGAAVEAWRRWSYHDTSQ